MHGVFKIHFLRWSEEGEEEAGLRKKEERRRGRKRWENYNGDRGERRSGVASDPMRGVSPALVSRQTPLWRRCPRFLSRSSSSDCPGSAPAPALF
jgi:hypothetical protein